VRIESEEIVDGLDSDDDAGVAFFQEPPAGERPSSKVFL
jgi:hypothetical protein